MLKKDVELIFSNYFQDFLELEKLYRCRYDSKEANDNYKTAFRILKNKINLKKSEAL